MKPFRHDVPERLLQRIIAPTLAALGITLLLGAIIISRIDAAHSQAQGVSFVLETSEITLKIEERFKAYRQVLRGARALFAASQVVTRDEWRRYVTSLRLHVDYAGIQGVGFAQAIPAAELAEHERRVRAEGFPDYRVTPPGQREEYTSIVFLEPFDWRNQRAFGYDMFSEPVRREAMARARGLGVPALTGKVRLVQETSTDVQFGVLLYLPVFRQNQPLGTPAERERALVGWVYSPFRLGDLLTGTLGDAGQHLRIRIFDGHDLTPDTLLFDSRPGGNPPDSPLQRKTLLELDSRVWTLVFDHTPGSAARSHAPLLEKLAVVLIGGLFVLLTAAFCVSRQRTHELARTSASLRASEARYSSLINLSHDGIAALDDEMRFVFINPRLARMLGYTQDALLGRSFDSLYPSHDLGSGETLSERLARGHATSFEQQLVKADGGLLTAIVADTPDLDEGGHLRGVIVTLTDISERKASEQRVHYLATHDSLTGLANRPMFMEHLNTSLLIARRHKTRFAVLFLDLDRFKEVNDTFGHAAGDALLVETAQRLRHSLRASDLPARQGGDEFMVLLHDIKTEVEALGVADKIRQAIDRPFQVEGHECSVAVSIGIALYPDDGDDAETLTRRADEAMYRAKTSGRGRGAASRPHAGRPSG